MNNFITNADEFEAAQQQILEYIESGREDDEIRIGNLILEIELYVLRETGSTTMLASMAALPEPEREKALQEFIRDNLGPLH